MELNAWTKQLRAIYDKAISLYREGNRDDASYFTEDETSFLASVGLRPINVYDYAEDFVTSGEPDWETYLLIAAARRDHFLFEQQGVAGKAEIRPDELPPKRATLDGIPWLPRIIKKASCFLEGALCHDIMYCCGGDRHFLREHALHPADFLRVVGAAKGDNQKILAFVKGSENSGSERSEVGTPAAEARNF
ncbi:MAG: hypothetical protein WBV90_06710 [Terrimicrobiaceae bacterium]